MVQTLHPKPVSPRTPASWPAHDTCMISSRAACTACPCAACWQYLNKQPANFCKVFQAFQVPAQCNRHMGYMQALPAAVNAAMARY